MYPYQIYKLQNQTTMRYSLLITILSIAILSSCVKKSDEAPLILHLTLTRTFDTILCDSNKHHCYDFRLAIINTSNQQAGYWAYTCGYDMNLTMNHSSLEMIGKDCDKNFPQIYQIAPHDSICYNFISYKSKGHSLFPITSTKIGLIYADPKIYLTQDDYIRFMGDRSLHKVIWSNPLNLDLLKKDDE